MALDRWDRDAIRRLIEDTQAAREALHGLILQIRGDRAAWERDHALLASRQRLTAAQRERFRHATSSTPPSP